MIAACAILSVLLAVSVVVNVVVITSSRQILEHAHQLKRTAEALARADRTPSGKIVPRRGGA